MTPKQKAEQLVESMAFSCRECDYEVKAKQCALIAVDEQLSMLAYMENYVKDEMGKIPAYLIYWQEVKKEIEAL
jgi:hypothetical protein